MADKRSRLIFKTWKEPGSAEYVSGLEYVNTQGARFKNEFKIGDLARRMLERFNKWIRQDAVRDREDFELLGRILYEIAFPTGETMEEDIRDAFDKDYTSFYEEIRATRDERSRFRMNLVFDKSAIELASYPWEYLFKPLGETDGFFLAGQRTDLILTRFVPEVTGNIHTTKQQIRILIVFAHPKELDTIDTKETREAIASIMKLHDGDSIVVELTENPTYKVLKEKIEIPPVKSDVGQKPDASQPHILHFIGHGDCALGLALIEEETEIDRHRREYREIREAKWCTSKDIKGLFDNHQPRLVFLHACEGARSTTLEGLSDLARELVYAKIPAVVAMQYRISTTDASMFATTFYTQLSKGFPIDEAVRAGRGALGLPGEHHGWSSPRFGVPVVYLQTEEAIIEVADRNSHFDEEERVPCPATDGCKARVPLGGQFCPVCKRMYELCPQCKIAGKYRLKLKEEICSFCGYPMTAATKKRSETPSTVPVSTSPPDTSNRRPGMMTQSGVETASFTSSTDDATVATQPPPPSSE